MTLEEVSPELFLLEYYAACGMNRLTTDLHLADRFGYCDSSRLLVRPNSGGYALMVELPDGVKYWCHVDRDTLEMVREWCENTKK